jgi:ribosome-binding protein aMBF1 (putative translation factor)
MAHIKNISERLRSAIDQSGLSWSAVGTASGIDRAAIGRFMKGTLGLSQQSIDKLGRLFGIKLEVTKPTGSKPAAKRKKGK